MNRDISVFNIIEFDEIDSTNLYIKNNYKNLPNLTVATANLQTAGRGRLGKSFHSPKGTGAYFSILLKEGISQEKSKYLTVMAAVAVAKEIEHQTNKQVRIKWVNDIYINGKKVCGILTEGAFNAQNTAFDYAVVGIGINLKTPENGFPEEISSIADSIFGNQCTDEQKRNLVNGILNRFYQMLISDDLSFIDTYRAYSYLDGKKINIIKGKFTESATALYIDENCNLVVKYDDTGKIDSLFSGDVSIKM